MLLAVLHYTCVLDVDFKLYFKVPQVGTFFMWMSGDEWIKWSNVALSIIQEVKDNKDFYRFSSFCQGGCV